MTGDDPIATGQAVKRTEALLRDARAVRRRPPSDLRAGCHPGTRTEVGPGNVVRSAESVGWSAEPGVPLA